MFHGSIVALVTPMHSNGEIDYKSLTHLLDWHLANDTDGFVILGTTGESVTVDIDEAKQIITHVVDHVQQKVPVIMGTGSNNTYKSVQMTQLAMELGADGALLVTPYYNKPTQEGLYQHYKAVAESVPIPQILYNVPGRTGCDLLPETVKRLSSLPNIVALKEATGSIERLKEVLALDCGLDLLSGDDGTAMEFLLQGGKGVISVTANVAPKLMHDMVHAAIAGDKEKAGQLNKRLDPINKALFAESNPIPTKWALQQMGKIESGIRLPMTNLSEKFHAVVKNALQSAQILEV